jgi:tetratricopeptide (TPR) repeat protein
MKFFTLQGWGRIFLLVMVLVICIGGCGGGKTDTSAKHWKKETTKNQWGDVDGHCYVQTVRSEGKDDEGDADTWGLNIVYYPVGNIVEMIIGEGDESNLPPFVAMGKGKLTISLRDESGNTQDFVGTYSPSNSSVNNLTIQCNDINLVQALGKNANYKILISKNGKFDKWHIRADIKGGLPTESNVPDAQKNTEAAPASTQKTNGNLSEGCSFAELKTSPLATFSSEDDRLISAEGNEIKLYTAPQTKDSILAVEIFGEMGKVTYKFTFNKNLIEAEESSCGYDKPFGTVASVDKKTLKTSKDAEKELREMFLTVRDNLYNVLRNLSASDKNATEYVKSGTEYLDRGDKNNNKTDYDLAIAEFDRAIKLDPNNATAYFGRGRGYLRKGDNSRAVADYSQALRLNPNDVISYSNRGRAYARMGDYDNAVADFESALRIDPNNNAIKQNLEKAKRREKGL